MIALSRSPAWLSLRLTQPSRHGCSEPAIRTLPSTVMAGWTSMTTSAERSPSPSTTLSRA
jgi:hypothetical protein